MSLFGLPVDAIASYALAGALLYYMRKHGNVLYTDGETGQPRTLLTAFRTYGLLGAASAGAFLIVLWRRQSLWTGLRFVMLSFLLSLVLQSFLGIAFIKRGHDRLSHAGLVIVPLAIGYAFFSLLT